MDKDQDGLCDKVDHCPQDPLNICTNLSKLAGHVTLRNPRSGVNFSASSTILRHLEEGGLLYESERPFFVVNDFVVNHHSFMDMVATISILEDEILRLRTIVESLQANNST